MTREEIKKDFLAFADDDSDVLFESTGEVMFYKNGTEQLCKIITCTEGTTTVEYQGEKFPYRTFIAKHLAKLDLFARKILEKRKGLKEFVDSPAILQSGLSTKNDKALKLLQQECDEFLEFGSKINFITADAGHGKSILLKQFQAIQAQRYIDGESKYIFWHVDLQGRDLVRLGEAIMFDLGELRLPGLYYPSIINLIQKRFIILAIDGFDELAAEIGGTKAVSSLSSFVNEMAGQGTLIAASRRTFFDTHDYLKRTSMLKSNVPFDINFNELKLQDWSKDEVIIYFKNLEFENPLATYDAILVEVHEENHPILTRPFLLAKLTSAIEDDLSLLSKFFNRDGNKNESVSFIVESFTKREVDKWKGIDGKTGKPYLTFDQHIHLLSTIAKEMWEAKKDFVSIEEIELYTVLLFDEWDIEEDLRNVILRITGSHAFLIPVNDTKINARKFDHEEFKNYFLARALAELINSSLSSNNYNNLKRFLYIEQLPDSVAMYCFNYVNNLNENVHKLINGFKELINSEWKPSYLQFNIGTLFPFMIDKIEFKEQISFDCKVNYSSLIFENKKISNVNFEYGTFINISLRDTILENINFKNCDFNDIKIEQSSRIIFKNVIFDNCVVNSISLINNGEVTEVAFSPTRIYELLNVEGISVVDSNNQLNNDDKKLKENSEFKKALIKFILKFNRVIIQYEKSMHSLKYLGNYTEIVIDEVIPLCLEHGIITFVETKNSKQAASKAWRLLIDIEELLKHDGLNNGSKLSNFWEDVNAKR